ncbi:hypothetical protein ACQ4PT_003565 [Festuca glaucescens]
MEVYLGWALVWVWVWLALLATRSWWKSTANHGLRLPPGPWTLPIIGSLHHLAGKLPHCALRDLARRHGPVMLLRLGEVPTLVISSPAAAREVLKTQDPAFASRSLTVTMRVVTCDGRDIIFSPYGEYWRQLRKVAVTELLTMRRVRSFRAIREEEVATMLHHVERAAAAGTPMDMRTRLSAIVSDTTFRAVMGDRCKQRDVFLRELDSLVGLTSGLNPVDLWPSSWIARLLSGDLRRAKKNHAVVFQIIREIVQEHLKGSGEEAEDLVDVLLKVHKDGGVDMLGVEAVIFVHIDN